MCVCVCVCVLCRLDRHMAVLRNNFALVGEVKEGEGEREEGEEGEWVSEGEGDGKLIKESDSVYSVWASGRVNCEGFLAQIKVCYICTHTHTHTRMHTYTHTLYMHAEHSTHAGTWGVAALLYVYVLFCSYKPDRICSLFYSTSSGPRKTPWSVHICMYRHTA